VKDSDEAELDEANSAANIEPGTVLDGGYISCQPGALQLLSVQPPGKKSMTFEAFSRGHHIEAGQRLAPIGECIA